MNNLELLSDVFDYIEEHLTEEIKTEDIADTCYCSKSTLEKLFRCVNNVSVHDYIIRRRMTRAARELVLAPRRSVLDIALEYGYSTNESFSRAFKQAWNINPSEYRERGNYVELYPRLLTTRVEGDEYMRNRKPVDISELYDLFQNRKDCYFVCCDIKNLTPINDISRKAGDLAILESMNRLQKEASNEDVVFRIGGDEFAVLTSSMDEKYAFDMAVRIKAKNGQPIIFEGKEIPLSLHVGIAKLVGNRVKYNELFVQLHDAIRTSKE